MDELFPQFMQAAAAEENADDESNGEEPPLAVAARTVATEYVA